MPSQDPELPMPTPAEVDILAALWRLGPATVREVHEELGKDLNYNTTLKQMLLMTEKGLLRRSERFRSHVYEPAAPKDRMQQQIAGDMMRRVFEGSAKGLIMGALGAKTPDAEELAEIRRMIDEMDSKKRRSK